MNLATATRRPLRIAVWALLAISTALPALASHFRYGHLNWRPVPGATNAANFEFRGAFRRSGYFGTAPDGRPAVGDTITETIGGTGLAFGDGASTGTLDFLVTSIDTTRDTLEGLALDPTTNMPLIRHDYGSAGPWSANVSGCCRIGALSNNPNGSYIVGTSVDFSIPGQSPVSAMPAIVTAGEGAITQIPVPAADADPNTTLQWRFATPAEAGTPFSPMSGLTIDGNTGVMTWDTTQEPAATLGTLWMCQVVIEDRDGATGAQRTQVAVDFIIEIVTGGPGNNCPSFDPATPCGQVVPATVGMPLTFPVSASDVDPGDTVTLNVAGLPAGASMSPVLPVGGNPAVSMFQWTPQAGDVGATVVNFTAIDSAGCQVLCGVTISVSATSCFVIDFETSDDLMTPLVNGEEIYRDDFGTHLIMGGMTLGGTGTAIFDTTPGGPNAAAADQDLLVGTGNCLILQDDPTQSSPGIYANPGDAVGGGRMGISFNQPVEMCSIDLIDVDQLPGATDGVMVMLLDVAFNSRTYIVPAGWTEDIVVQGGSGIRTLDLTTMAPQPGFSSTATAVESGPFDPTSVSRVFIGWMGSGAIDNLSFQL